MSEHEVDAAFERSYGNVGAVKRDGLLDELEHARFRDADLSVKGSGLLAFKRVEVACRIAALMGPPG